MENCVIYSHYLDFEKVVEIVKNQLPKAKVQVEDGGMQKSLNATISGGFFGKTKALKINYRQRLNPSYKIDTIDCGLTQNLAGMCNFIESLNAKNGDVKNQLIYKVRSLNCEMPFIGEPEITAEFGAVLKTIVQELDGIVFAQPTMYFQASSTQHFLDKNLKLILDTNGNSEIDFLDVKVDAKYHDQPPVENTKEQLVRKAKSEAFLQGKDIKINKNLPCVQSSENAVFRPKSEVIERAYCLLLVAAKGEGIDQLSLDRAIADKKVTAFSPRETAVISMTDLDDNTKAYATWRYESLTVLLWALGKIEALVYPSEICNVQEIVGIMIQPSREDFENTTQLRDPAEILDELDKIYRMNWACVDARIKGESPTGNIHPGIVYERHYALNWLTKYQNQDWDDVQTNT